MATAVKKTRKPKPKAVSRESARKFLATKEGKNLLKAASVAVARADVSARLGNQYEGDRDIYTALGYLKKPTFKEYLALYRRNDVARAVVSRPVRPCWRMPPLITEGKDTETPFEAAVTELADRLRLWHYMARVDKLARLGQYALLYIGFSDVDAPAKMAQPVTKASDVVYLMPYSEGAATVETVVDDTSNPMYGRPDTYKITTSGAASELAQLVHHTRVIHVTQDNLENDVYGTPALENPFNRLYDIEKVVGGTAEAFWRMVFPPLTMKLDPDATLGEQDLSELIDEIEDVVHGFKRYMRVQGITIEQLLPNIADPTGNIDAIMRMIATGMEIPKRILEGSERGELSSSQDERAWVDYIDERRRQHCEPVIVRAFLDRCIDVGVLKAPTDGYTLDWPDLAARTDKERADVAKVKAEAVKTYGEGMDAQAIYPVDQFQMDLGMSPEEIEQAAGLAEEASNDVNGTEQGGENGSEE